MIRLHDFKSFYSCYTNSVHIIWGIIPDDEDVVFEVTKDLLDVNSNSIATNVFTSEEYNFVHPEKFDHDHHTNLFFKLSPHELSIEDHNVQKYRFYRYTVKGKRISDNEIWFTKTVHVKIE